MKIRINLTYFVAYKIYLIINNQHFSHKEDFKNTVY